MQTLDGLLQQAGDELSTTLVALITSAVHDAQPTYSLTQLHSAFLRLDSLCELRVSSCLDPLNILPNLLLCPDVAAQDILAFVGEHGSAKEIVISVQEAVEALETTVQSEDFENEDKEADSVPRLAPVIQLVRLVHLYDASIPRLKPSKKSPLQTLRPLLYQLQNTIALIAPSATVISGRSLIVAVSSLISNSMNWLNQHKEKSHTSETERNCSDILITLLDTTLESAAHSIAASIAIRQFERDNPRFILPGRSNAEPGWEGGVKAVKAACQTAESAGFKPASLLAHDHVQLSMGTLILLAHDPSPEIPVPRLLSSLLPLIITSLQTAIALDETLFILYTSLLPLSRSSSPHYLAPKLTHTLLRLLPVLCSTHPSPAIRHLTFRILAILLSLCQPPTRLTALHSLLADGPNSIGSTFPQMRVAAVELVKEGVLQALSSSNQENNLLASPTLFNELGGLLFRPDPPDLFSTNKWEKRQLDDFFESSEPARLTACLGFYYVLLQRDDSNRTGARDPDRLLAVDVSLLNPLRRFLRELRPEHLSEHDVNKTGHVEHLMKLAPLATALERVDDALKRRTIPVDR